MPNGISMDRVDAIVDSYGCQRHHLIAIMQDIQAEYKYLSPEVLERIAQKLDIVWPRCTALQLFMKTSPWRPRKVHHQGL